MPPPTAWKVNKQTLYFLLLNDLHLLKSMTLFQLKIKSSLVCRLRIPDDKRRRSDFPLGQTVALAVSARVTRCVVTPHLLSDR